MKCRIFRKSAAFFIIFLCALALCAPARGATLASILDDFAKYQTDPLSRAEELRKEIRRIQETEEGFARQYGLKISDVLEYEFALVDLVDAYNSLYFIQNEGEVRNTFLLDDGRITALSRQNPPYPFIFYLDICEDVSNCRRELEDLRRDIDTARAKMIELREKKTAAEKSYRLLSAHSSVSAEERLKHNFELNVQKARLELCLTQLTYYEHSFNISRSQTAEVEAKLDLLDPLIKRVRANISKESGGFDYLNSFVFRHERALRDTLEKLNERFKEMDDARRDDMELTPLERYCNATGRRLASDEAVYVLDMIKLWSATRLAWRSTYDLLLERTSFQENRETLELTKSLITYAETRIGDANSNLQMIRAAEQEVQRRCATIAPEPTQQDEDTKNRFMRELAAQKQRYLSYIVALGAMLDQFETLQGETERALGESGADEKLQDLWAQNFGGLLNMEMWSIGDYPITLKKLLLAVLLFFAGFFVTRFASARAKKHFEKAGTLSKHSLILVQNLVFYAGVIFSFLLTLWTLRIPLTAFAFMGGAAAIAIGLGMQKLMGDMIAGILLFFQKKIRIGDEVIIGGTYGIVSEITLQNTVLICQQTRHLIIPNSKMLDSSVLNLTLNNSISRYDLEVSIDYESDVEKAMALIRTILSENKSILKTPPFRTVVSEFEDSGIQITAYFFIDLSRTIESSVKSELRLRILEAFRENGIEMPYPQVDVHMRSDGGDR